MWKPPGSVFLEFKGQQKDWKSWLAPIQRGLTLLGQGQCGYAMHDGKGK